MLKRFADVEVLGEEFEVTTDRNLGKCLSY